MDSQTSTIIIQLLDKTYDVQCPPDRIQDLQQAARELDTTLRQLSERRGHKNDTQEQREQLIIMSALNFSHELILAQRQQQQHIDQMYQAIQALQNQVNSLLETEQTE